MTLALVDGDVIAYLSCKSRYVTEEGHMRVVDKGSHVFSHKENTQYLMSSYGHFQNLVEYISDTLYTTDILMAVKSEENYRDKVYKDYKANRKNNTYNSSLKDIVPELRKIAVFEELAIESTGREADDMLSIWAHQARRSGDPYVIVSIDKDLKCIPGMYFKPLS